MIKNEEDAMNYFLGGAVSTLFVGLGLGVIFGVMAAQDTGHPNWAMVAGLIFAMVSFVVFYTLVKKLRKAGYKVKLVKKVEGKNECR